MIEAILRTAQFRRYFPPIAGVIFIAVFVSLGLWQLERADEKKLLLSRFESDQPYARVPDYALLDEFDRIQLEGEFLPERQVLIENIIVDSRPGYYVVTPFRPNTGEALLLVNRGWTPRSIASDELPALDVDNDYRRIKGLAGHLPRVAIRPGEAFASSDAWPRVAVYPTADEIAAQLGERLLPTLLLLGPDEEGGFVRRWQPNISGPGTHYGYAFQWFAMAATVAGLIYWNLRQRSRRGRRNDTDRTGPETRERL